MIIVTSVVAAIREIATLANEEKPVGTYEIT
jgi:hypothetical protein